MTLKELHEAAGRLIAQGHGEREVGVVAFSKWHPVESIGKYGAKIVIDVDETEDEDEEE